MEKLALYFKGIGIKRFIAMILGNVILGMGISIFKYAGMGNDPFTAMALGAADFVGLPYPRFLIIMNIGFLIIEFIFGRHYIGIGTIVNAIFLGYIVTFFFDIWVKINTPPVLFLRQFPLMLIGVVVTGLGVSFYQTSDAGISPFDSMSIIMTERIKKIPYFWNRVFTDACCAVVCYLCGGLLGLGTLVCAFCLGPVVHFFNKHFSEKVIICQKHMV